MKFKVEPNAEAADIVADAREIDASEVADIFTVANDVPLTQETDAPGFLDLGTVEKPDTGAEIEDPEGTIEVDDEGNVITPKDDEIDPSKTDIPGVQFDKRKDVVDNKDDDTSFFSEVAGVLKNKGVFKTLTDVDDDFLKGIKSESDLADLISREAKAQMDAETVKIQQQLSGTQDDARLAEFDVAINSVNNVNVAEFAKDVESSKTLFIQEYARKGIEADTAGDFFDMYTEKGVIEDKLTEVLLSRKAALEEAKGAIVTKQQSAIDAETARVTANETKLNTLIESGEIFGRKLNSTTVGKLKDLAATEVGKDEDGRSLNALMKAQKDDPIGFEYKMMYLFAATNGLKDMSSFERSAESRVSKDFKNALNGMRDTSVESINKNTSKSKVYTIDPDSIDDIIV